MFFTTRTSGEKHSYGLLPRSSLDCTSEDPESICATDQTTTTSPCRSLLTQILLRCIVFFMALYGALSALSTIYIRTPPPQRPSCNCGDTIDEAISNSCIYDEMAAAWLPPACRDDELSSQFSQSGPNSDGSWTYYGDKNKTVSMTAYDLSQLPLTGGHFFATHEWHVVHCSYYWKKMARARELGTVLEKRYDTDMHIGHCEMMFLKRDPLDKIVTEAGVSLHSDVLVVAKPEEHKHDQHGDSEIDVEED